MLYKRPIIALTSLLDLLFILIFAYQMDIKTNADEYVQAEVEKRTSLGIPDQRRLVVELQAKNKSITAELIEANKELEKQLALDVPDQRKLVKELQAENESVKAELAEVNKESGLYKTQRNQLNNELMSVSISNITKNVLNDKFQSENHSQQVVELRNALKKKERELATVKQENERIKKQSKPEGVIPITDKDAELAKALVGTWKGSSPYRGIYRSYRTTLNPDNSFTEYKTITANVDCMVGTLRLNKGESVSHRISGKWWVKGGYIHYFIESSNNTKVTAIGHSSSSKILSVDKNISKFQEDDNSISTDYRID